MRVNGRVINGRIEIEEDVSLPEGASVEVMIRDREEEFELSEDDERQLWESDQEIERGESITAEELLEQIRSRSASR